MAFVMSSHTTRHK